MSVTFDGTYDLVIVGAGIAGLNALFVASEYLGQQDRVLLIDRNPKFGGMWANTYDYVRLHQPHRMFTAGDIPWALDAEPGYLASKSEVLAHFDQCMETLRAKFLLDELYEHEYVGHDEQAAGKVHVECRSLELSEHVRSIKTRRLIKAFGFSVPTLEPYPLSSQRPKSISPNDPSWIEHTAAAGDAPIYIIGGGKTAMDTAKHLIDEFPGRELNLIVGKGVVFGNRDTTFPRGWRRWFAGTTTLEYFMSLCERYDGMNEAEVFEYFKSERTLHLAGTGGHYMFGFISRAENEKIARGVSAVINEYLDDVIDEPNGQTLLRCRSGESFAIEAGSVFVNCTGYIFSDDGIYEPYISERGSVLSIQPNSAMHFLSTFSAYFLTHLFYLDLLNKLPLYEVNYGELIAKDKVAMPFVAMTQSLYNLLLIVEAVPSRVMLHCGLDFDRWFPLHRRLLAGMRLRRKSTSLKARYKATLDTVRERYSITCGELKY